MRCDAMRYDTIRYDTIRYDTIRLFSHVSGFLIHYSHLQGTITAKAFEHSQSKSIFFHFLDIVAIRIFDSAATNVFNVHFVNRCECDVRSYILYDCFNPLILICILLFSIAVYVHVYM